jgi:hypothetical protein
MNGKRKPLRYLLVGAVLLLVMILVISYSWRLSDFTKYYPPSELLITRQFENDNQFIKGEQTQPASEPTNPVDLLVEDGKRLHERFNPPAGYKRLSPPVGSFASYLQNLPLKPNGETVHYYDGREKGNKSAYEAVIEMDIGTRDLQQCADAIMRLRGEYLFYENKKDRIHFNLTNGFRVNFSEWIEGNRVKVEGNTTTWVHNAERSETYETFRDYMNFVFIYAGTLSLAQELEPVPIETMSIGDVFIVGGSPGHAVIVVDMAMDSSSGKVLYMLAQSYMPAQDIQILSSPSLPSVSPWYELTEEEAIVTPEWTFKKTDLKRFAQE